MGALLARLGSFATANFTWGIETGVKVKTESWRSGLTHSLSCHNEVRMVRVVQWGRAMGSHAIVGERMECGVHRPWTLVI